MEVRTYTAGGLGRHEAQTEAKIGQEKQLGKLSQARDWWTVSGQSLKTKVIGTPVVPGPFSRHTDTRIVFLKQQLTTLSLHSTPDEVCWNNLSSSAKMVLCHRLHFTVVEIIILLVMMRLLCICLFCRILITMPQNKAMMFPSRDLQRKLQDG